VKLFRRFFLSFFSTFFSFLFLKRGLDKALCEGDAVGQAHKRIALLYALPASSSRGSREKPGNDGFMTHEKGVRGRKCLDA
jgi:hypothetical protein